ncbi:hypothetical protein [Campylobacter helveticus]|nr:hypothetical protein [Campylobacter helveticus]MCR2066071.1 hypothetical protein [Campylobacter helveticus]
MRSGGLGFSVFTSNAVRFRNSSHKCERYALEVTFRRNPAKK